MYLIYSIIISFKLLNKITKFVQKLNGKEKLRNLILS